MGIAPLNPSIVQKLRDKLDVDGDGGVDLNDAMAALDKLTEPKCKRRKSSDSEKGYCGIHMRKHAEPLPLTD